LTVGAVGASAAKRARKKRTGEGVEGGAEAIDVLMERSVRCQAGLYHKGAEGVNLRK
jgi:hypothetical protein